MALKDNLVDKIDGVDDVLSEHINDVANGVIELEEFKKPSTPKTEILGVILNDF